jgi:hypothetical protein
MFITRELSVSRYMAFDFYQQNEANEESARVGQDK